MKIIVRRALVFLGCALLYAVPARAGFVISTARYDVPSSLAQVVVFMARNDGLGDQAGTTKIQSIDITLSTTGKPFAFDFRDVDGDGAADANVKGVGFNFPLSSADPMPTGSFIRIGSSAAFFIPQSGTDNGAGKQAFTDVDGDGTPDGNNPVFDYAGIAQFTVQGTLLGGGVAANASFVPFALALVPKGTTVNLTGNIAAEAGRATAVAATDVPEPASTLSLVIAGASLLFKRGKRVTPRRK
jgi:hypothetical protein